MSAAGAPLPEEKYRVAVIGRTGRGNYGHGLDTVWLENDRTDLIAVADDNQNGLKSAAKRLRVKNAYSDYRKMLEKERPQIVAVAPRWIDAHRDMVLACAEYGANIFLEKPFCRTLAEADAIVRACEEKHIKLAIAHQTRYSPKVPVIREILESGRLGDVLEFRGRGKEDRRGGGEDLWVLGTHVFDLMQLFGGEVEWCYARVTQNGKPVGKEDVKNGAEGIGPLTGDGLEAMYGLKSGATAFFSSHREKGSRPPRFGLTVQGSKGVLETHTGYLPDTYLLEDPTWSPGRTGSKWQTVTSAGVGEPEPLKNGGLHAGNLRIVDDLLDSIEKDRQPNANVYTARAATEMIVAVFESHRQGRPVAFPLKNRDNPLLAF